MKDFNEFDKIKEILKFEYEAKMISEGNNFPNININEYNLRDVCVLLHNKISLNSICSYFRWSQKDLSTRLEILLKEELIKKKHNEYIPYLMVISLQEGKDLCEGLSKIAYKVINLINKKLDTIKEETYKFQCFKSFSFNELSLFILSDVILDCIQINNVESMFLKNERTNRNDMNYYFSLMEKHKNSKKEALNIYGNMVRDYGNIEFGLYGNERNGINFHTINKVYLEKYFGNFNLKHVNDIKQYLLEELMKKFHRPNYELDKNLIKGFNSLGIMKGNKISIPVLTEDEENKLKNIADIIKNDYIDILEENRENIYSKYSNSSYSNEISFEEYFIWWYHLLYSNITDILIKDDIIQVPDTGNFSYIIY